MTLKAKILKRAASDGRAHAREWSRSVLHDRTYLTDDLCEARYLGAIEGARWQSQNQAPLLEALAECAEALSELAWLRRSNEALSNLERLVSSETKERDE